MDLIAFFLVILLTITILKWLLKRRENFHIFEKLGIPGPKPSLCFGNIWQLINLGKISEVKWAQKYGSIFGFFLGTTPILAVTDSELLKIILVKKAHIFHRRNPIIPNVGSAEKLLGLSTVLIHGPSWKQNRDMMTPSFTTSKLKMMTTTVNSIANEYWKEMKEMIDNGKILDMEEIISTAVADMTFQIALGVRIKNRDKVTQSLRLSFDTDLTNPINFLSVCFPEMKNLLHLIRISYHRIRNSFSLPSTSAMAEMCKNAISARLSMKTTDYADFLQQMINTIFKRNEVKLMKKLENSEHQNGYSKSPLTYTDCLANSFYAVLATFDTIRNPLIFATYHIAKYPEIQDKIREEIYEHNTKEENISYLSLSKMKYLDQVFSETLRLNPPAASFINRIADEDFKYKNILIPKGMTVYVPQFGLNRNSEHWTNPDEFRPERFEDKSVIDPYIYQPFGIGPRHCAGMRPAQLISKLILASLVKNFKISLHSETKELEPVYGLVITTSKHPVYIEATPI